MRPAGAWWLWAAVIGTIPWSAWESGLDYWRCVLRMDVMVVLALIMAGGHHFMETPVGDELIACALPQAS